MLGCTSEPSTGAESSSNATETAGDGDGDGDGDAETPGDGDGESGDGDGEPNPDLPGPIDPCAPPLPGFVCLADGGFVFSAIPPTTILLDHIDGDDELDLVISGISAAGLRVLPGLGGGQFAEEPIVSNLALGVRDIVSGDLDGDQDADLGIAAIFNLSGVGVSLGDGTGAFGPAPLAGIGDIPRALTLADLDEDDAPDLVIVDEALDQIYVVRNLGDGSFEFPAAVSFAVGEEPYELASADLDGDGHLDVVTVDRVAGALTILWGDGTGSFADAQTEAVGEGPRALTIADLDGDGRLDLVTADFGSDTVSLVHNLGDRGFAPAEALAVGAEPYAVVAVELTGDGRLDIVSADSAASTLTIHPSAGGAEGGYGEPVSRFVGPQPFDIAAADLDGDSRSDLAVALFGASTVAILLTGG